MKRTAIREYDINIHKENQVSQSVKAVFITDYHNTIWKDDKKYLPELIRGIEPDVILCGGDMIVAHPDESVKPGLDFMMEMLDIAPVYFSLGNHEFRSRIYPETYGDMYDQFMKPLLANGLHLLVNKSTDISIKGLDFTIYGLEIPRKNYKRLANIPFPVSKMEKYIGKVKEERISILLAHNPKFIETYQDWGADITLCGHYHGGIMRFGEHLGAISPGLMPFTPIAHGRFDNDDKTIIISGGLGEHTLPIRINNPRELVVLNINVNESEN